MHAPAAPPTLNLAAILATGRKAPVAVAVPEWGGTVYVREMSARERDNYECELLAQPKESRNIRALLAAYTLADESGSPLCGPADAAALAHLSAAGMDRVFAVASRLNRLTKKDVDELAGN